jgi:hypothetical protein
MKSKIFILVIFLAGIVILFPTGCKKNEKKTETLTQSTPAPNNQSDMKLARMYSAFKQKGSQKLKDGEDMTIDSAIWYLQGTANFTYGKASVETSKTEIDSTFITLTITDNKITLTEVWNKYSEMIDSIRASYQKIAGDENQLMSVQVDRHQLTETELVCKVTSIISISGPIPNFCVFNSIDSWIWWNQTGQGICNGPNAGQHPELDAAILINQKIMNCMGVPAGNYYWTEPETVDLWPESYPNPNWGGAPNYEKYLLYWNHSSYPNFHGCLSPEECNFYLSGTKWVINTDYPSGARPAGKSLISVAIHGDALFDVPNLGNSAYLHRGPAYYGILHWNANPALHL